MAHPKTGARVIAVLLLEVKEPTVPHLIGSATVPRVGAIIEEANVTNLISARVKPGSMISWLVMFAATSPGGSLGNVCVPAHTVGLP